MKLDLDLKNVITLGTLLFVFAGFYYNTTSEVKYLTIEASGLRSENHDIRKRLDALDKRLSRINKVLKGIKNENH